MNLRDKRTGILVLAAALSLPAAFAVADAANSMRLERDLLAGLNQVVARASLLDRRIERIPDGGAPTWRTGL